MLIPPEIWQQLLDDQHAPLLAQAAACGLAHPNQSNHPNLPNLPSLNAITKLRKQYSLELVTAAIQLTDARRRAVAKFPDRADSLLADVEGVEQASSLLVAEHKAKRFAAVASPSDQHQLFDLCCGIGGDAIAFVNAGFNVTAIDADPARTFMAQHNAQCTAQCSDVETWLGTIKASTSPGDERLPLFHIDPARRTNAGRAWKLADYTPGPAFLRQLLERIPTGAIKLGPGVHADELADELTSHVPKHELEFISEHGRLVQAVLWTGDLANVAATSSPTFTPTPSSSPSTHSATLLPRNVTLTGQPGEPPIDDIEQYLFTVDASVERAQLLHVLCETLGLHAVHPALGLLTSAELVESPWLTAFEFIEELPWRLKKVQAWLREHDAGIVEVKTRGKAVNPDVVQRQLRGSGTEPFTIFVMRFDEQVRAIITKRLATPLQ